MSAIQKRSLLDQLTDAATVPDAGLPAALAPAIADPTSPASTDPGLALANAPATSVGSTANLESLADSPDQTAAKIASTAQTQQNDQAAADKAEKDANPSFLKKLGRLAGGAVGFQDPDSSPQAGLGARIGQLAGRVGNSLALAAGTPEQKQIAEEQNQVPLKLAQIRNDQEYRRGLLGAKDTANDIHQQVADQQQQKATGAMRLKLMVPDEKNPGAYRSMTEDEILSDPIASQNQELVRSTLAVKRGETELSHARADALMNPNNPTLVLKAREIEARLKIAQAQMGMRIHQQQRQDFQDLLNYGEDVGGRTLNADNAAPFMATDAQGNPVPNKQAGVFKPTTAARSKGEQANTIIDSGEALIKDIQAHADVIGPLASRYGDLTTFIGNPPPEFKSLAAELESWIALHPAAHGFRGQNAVQAFEKAFGPIEMTPEALIAGIRGSYNTMGALQRTATPHTTGPKGTATPTAAPIKSFADWKKSGGK